MPTDLPRDDNRPDRLWQQGPVWTAGDTPLAKYVARPIREFLRIESAGSVLLLAATAAALIWVNAGGASSYADLWHTTLGIDLGGWRVEESLQHWVNDGLMAIFFFVVGLEIKYELVSGDLRDPRTAALPILAAVGGMVVPAGLYLAVAGRSAGAHGWGVPMATDIAFAVGVLGLLGRRVPPSLRLFLLTLAVVDDVGAIVVIAVVYSHGIDLAYLGLAVAGLLVAYGVRRNLAVFLLVGTGVWWATLGSGVHATIAGVLLALLVPTSVAARLEHRLEPWSALVVLPVFALANAGVRLFGAGLEVPSVAVAVGVGLVVGKLVGVLGAGWLAIRAGLAELPHGATWRQLAGVSAIAGIGFTVSLFVSGLAFDDAGLVDSAKVGVLAGSVVAALLGSAVLAWQTDKQ